MSDDIFGEVIHAYTRAEALADGFMHDISELASEYGFRYPVHVAQYAWADAISWPHTDACQDETGRAWDVLTMARLALQAAIRRGVTSGPVRFTVVRITEPDRTEPEPITLEIELGPGDAGEPVFTITAGPDR
ncbi:DUF6573 family protein [Nocardia wallacei]|uniref:Uncharacterized protein n=1 Tax=Nocardia wallacei TaxID=480035 RepID=A0A7G1L249_9NOCA|nr:DUF6573 family protein [Nocardia wallacei]BCK59454.1 hypothetical protein NWFMUON74_72260 [Nocardia wallacei]